MGKQDPKLVDTRWKIEQVIDVAKVPSSFPVGFCLLTQGQRQYVAYYDEDRRKTVAMRTLDSEQWRYQVLPSKVGWDSHNGITMTLDGPKPKVFVTFSNGKRLGRTMTIRATVRCQSRAC